MLRANALSSEVFPGVGVSYQRNETSRDCGEDRRTARWRRTSASSRFNTADPLSDAAAVDFEFGFARAARADAAAQSRKIGADTDQIRLTVAQLSELDLKLSFSASRVAREDVENQHRAVDDRQRNDPLEILALPWAQIVEHQEQTGMKFARALGDLVGLAASYQCRRIDRIATLHDAIEHLGAGSLRERFELGELRLDRTPRSTRLDGDDEGALRSWSRDRERHQSIDEPPQTLVVGWTGTFEESGSTE